MMEETNNKKITIILIAVIVVAVLAIVLYLFKPSVLNIITKPIGIDATRPTVIENEVLVIPDTQKITGAEGSAVGQGTVAVVLVPKDESEKVIVPKAVVTVKGSYDIAQKETESWSSDAQLALIKSMGAVTLEGKSSQWQVIFYSKKLKKGYEIIIQGDQIVSRKEIDSNTVGAAVPKNWLDSGDAIMKLQAMSGYVDASISTINFFYNSDAGEWRYGFSTSVGATSLRF